MIFMLPVAVALKAAVATITVGEAIGIGTAVFGIGIGIKGGIDFHKAKQLKAEAEAEYKEMVNLIKRRTDHLKKSLDPTEG